MYRAIGDKIKLESGKFSYTLDPYRIGPGKHFVVLKVYGSTPREVLYSKELWLKCQYLLKNCQR